MTVEKGVMEWAANHQMVRRKDGRGGKRRLVNGPY